VPWVDIEGVYIEDLLNWCRAKSPGRTDGFLRGEGDHCIR